MIKNLAIVFLLCVSSLFAQNSLPLTVGQVTASVASGACQPGAVPPIPACVSLQVLPMVGSATVTVSGTFSATLQFEDSPDGGTTWQSISGTPYPAGGTAVSSTTAAGSWSFSAATATYLRVRASAYASGTALVVWSPSTVGGATSGSGSAGGTTSIVGPTAGGNPCFGNPSAVVTSVVSNPAAAGTTQLVALSAGKSIYVCSGYFGNGSGTTPTLSFEYGTGSTCGTGTTAFYPAVAVPAASAAPVLLSAPTYVVPSGNALCAVLGGTTPTASLAVTYVQQ
jgi:hypothetical protein